MKKLRWQLFIIFLTGLVVGILLLGEQPEPPPPPGVATPEPVQGGVYTEALVGSLMRLNPLLNRHNPADRDVTRLIFSGLFRYDSSGAPQPDLADTWGVSQDGTLYNITIRPDALWHDGNPITADDVLFTIELIRQGGEIIPPDLQAFWQDIDVVRLDKTVLQFRLPAPFAPFTDYLSFAVMPRHLLEGNTITEMIDLPYNFQPVGSGPYRFSHLIVEDGQIAGVSLTAFTEYYGQAPFIDEVVFRYYPDSESAFQAYKDGQVQGISQVTASILPQVLAEPRLALYTVRQPEMSLIMFNLKNPDVPFFQDVKVRRALLTGLNRQGMIDRLLQGQAVLSDGPILPDTWAYFPGLKRVEYDPSAAQALLKEAGYILAAEGDVVRKKDETALSFSLVYPDDDEHQRLAESIRAQWSSLGVEVALEPVPYDLLLREHLEQRNFQAVLVDLNLSNAPDPDPYPFWDQAQSTSGQNYTQWDNRVASEYLEQARVTVNLQERAKFYRNFQIIFVQELPALPLFYPVYTYAIDRDVQGVRVGPLFDTSERFSNVPEWFLADLQRQDAVVAPASSP